MHHKKWKAIFIIRLESDGGEHNNVYSTSQIARDKLLAPIQEMWITHVLDKFSIEEIQETDTKSILARDKEMAQRESFYKTGFPDPKKKEKK